MIIGRTTPLTRWRRTFKCTRVAHVERNPPVFSICLVRTVAMHRPEAQNGFIGPGRLRGTFPATTCGRRDSHWGNGARVRGPARMTTGGLNSPSDDWLKDQSAGAVDRLS